MSTDARHTRRKRTLSVAGVVLAVCGVMAIVVAGCAQQSAPQPPASAAVPIAVTSSGRSSPPGMTSSADTARSKNTAPSAVMPAAVTSSATGVTGPAAPTAPSADPPAAPPAGQGHVVPRSLPTHLSIPALGVESNLKHIGLTSDGHITTPPLAKDSHAYWLDVSPTPGELGPSVILGHVDSAKWGPAVFFDLGNLRQRDRIAVTLADHTVAVFEVTHVDEYKKAQFPTQAVYGNTDRPELRLMTCGGLFDAAARSYESNIVVYAALVSSHRE